MNKSSTKNKTEGGDVPSIDVVRLLVEMADADTVYRDIYLKRARTLLVDELPVDQYRALKTFQRQIDDATAQSRAAAILQDWRRVEELTEQAEQLRRNATLKAALTALGEQVYDAPSLAIDPFSPGLKSFAKAGVDLAELRDQMIAKLPRLATADASHAAFYEKRRTFLASLTLAQRKSTAKTKEAGAPRAIADIERLAFEAAQRGDLAELRRYAQEILVQQAAEAKTPTSSAVAPGPKSEAPSGRAADPCPVDLSAPFPEDLTPRARALGLAVARTEPLPEAAPLFDYVAARMLQPPVQETESEHEGAMKIEALVDQSALPPGVAEHVKVLVGQFVRHTFVNSGGARYRPAFSAESVLIEDFPEDQEPPTDSGLLTALGLTRRRALTRTEIENALSEYGAKILEEQLGLDPQEFRLVCVPQDLYSRFGRDQGWGGQRQWTHFDGYQVVKGGRLRALVGGDVRYGGLNDLVSIAPSDQRESVVARFAVIRRARQVARWR